MANLTPTQSEGLFYISGLVPSMDSVTPNRIVNISTGRAALFSVADSNVSFDVDVTTQLSANSNVVGVNGLDTGTLASATVYAIYVIGSQGNFEKPACLLSLSLTSPVMPRGANGSTYDLIRRVGFIATNGTSDNRAFVVSGSGNFRKNVYTSPIEILIAATATTPTAVTFISTVPPIGNTMLDLQVKHTPNAAGNGLILYVPSQNTAPTPFILTGAVAAVSQSGYVSFMSEVVTNATTIQYKNSAASGSSTIALMGFDYTV